MAKMTKVDIEIAVFKTIVFVVVITIIVLAGLRFNSWIKEQGRIRDIQIARRVKENARYPDTGDRIDLDGKEIIILKRYFWSTERRYEVRLPNGEITDVLGSEIIDKKPIGEKDGN